MEKNIALIAVFAALIAALGLIPKIELAAGVPITAQSMGIMLSGTVLGSKKGGLAALLFVVLTLAGLPLLSGGRGGLGLLAGPSIGYILGFPLAAFVTGLIFERLKGAVLPMAILAAFLGGVVFLSIPGILGMAFMLEKSIPEATLIASGFVIGDTIKAVVAGFVTQAIARARPETLLSRPGPKNA